MTTRRDFLQRSSKRLAASGLIAAGGSTAVFAHGDHDHEPQTIGHGSHRYTVDKQWGMLNPRQYPIINCHAMVQSETGLLYTLTDVKANNLIVYQPDGTFVEAMDLEYSGGHGLAISKEGDQEFLYIADGGWANRYGRKVSNEAGRIAKTDLQGQLQFTIGHPQTIGVYEPGQKFKPCDIAIAPNGDLYVSDGYGSQCILQYDQHGQYIRHWGGKDDSKAERHMDGAHGISVDLRNPAEPVLLAASRNANHIKKFTLEGDLLGEIHLPGAYAGQLVVQGDFAYTAVCWSKENGTGKRLPRSGFVIVLDDQDRVVSCPGGNEPIYQDGKLQPLSQAADSPFIHGHDLWVDKEGSIYVCQWNAEGVYPIKLTRA